MTYITSRANERVKNALKLSDKKYRQITGLFRFEGAKLLEEYLLSGEAPTELYVREDALEKYRELVEKLDEDSVFVVTDEVYEKLTEEKSPQGLLCIGRKPKNIRNGTYEGGGIVLESVRDCGNMGTILRSAAAFGAKRVYLSKDCADVLSQKTTRAAMGALFKTDILICDDLTKLFEAHKQNKKTPYAAMPYGDATEIDTVKLSVDDLVVIGNEGHGVSETVKNECRALTIPMCPNTESVNAAVAASVILWEMWRR
ncbi:MAG: RNA methyltransferase [Clostridia bacterium]|nr:RNA methyltransferase [Clostridia bacterium]